MLGSGAWAGAWPNSQELAPMVSTVRHLFANVILAAYRSMGIIYYNAEMPDISPPSPKLLELLARRDSPLVDLSLKLREIVLEEAPSAMEMVHDVKYAIALNYTFTKSVKQAFCGIAIYRHHLNLGFYRGAELADPRKLLEGDGKLHRHLKFAAYKDLERPHLRPFLRAAIEKAKPQL